MLNFQDHTLSPLDDSQDRASRAVQALMAATRGRRPLVLVLQRDGFVGRRIRRLLGKAGCRIILTDDDEAAGLLLDQEEEGIDLLVVDLPEGERGGELDGPLKAALRRHGRIPVLLLSDPTLSSADASGLPCLQKPFGPTELLETTAMVLGGRLPAS